MDYQGGISSGLQAIFLNVVGWTDWKAFLQNFTLSAQSSLTFVVSSPKTH